MQSQNNHLSKNQTTLNKFDSFPILYIFYFNEYAFSSPTHAHPHSGFYSFQVVGVKPWASHRKVKNLIWPFQGASTILSPCWVYSPTPQGKSNTCWQIVFMSQQGVSAEGWGGRNQALRNSWRLRCFNPQFAVYQGKPTSWCSGSTQMQYS